MPCAISCKITDCRSYSDLLGPTPVPRYQLANELTVIIISGLLPSRSFPASAFASADGYQRLESGAPGKFAK